MIHAENGKSKLDASGESIRSGFRTPQLTIVIPTFNERGNLPELLARIEATLGEVAWEVIVVDDNSPDGTSELAKEIARQDPRVRCMRRVNRRGLAGACIDGMLASSATYVAVMDADLQHDETILPQMLAALQSDLFDLVVGSRHVDGGSADGGFSGARARISDWANGIARFVLKTELIDLMSGYFMLRRDLFDEISPLLSPSGFKILADIVVSSPQPLRTKEVPYQFRNRLSGESKLDLRVGLDFVSLLINKISGGLLPPSFILFSFVGALGVLVHLVTLRATMVLVPPLGFGGAEIFATLVAMTSNFFINNATTYRDSKLQGRGMLKGFFVFCLVCTFGSLANIGIAVWLYSLNFSWWLSAIAGIAMGAVWNYTTSSLFVWHRTI